MIRKNKPPGKSLRADSSDLSALLDAQRVISALSPEDHIRLLEILDRQPRSAETVMGHIQHITKAERKRLGMMLAKADILPDYKVVKAYGLWPVSQFGLMGENLQLFNYLQPIGSRHHRNDVIRHLWPADAAHSQNLATDKTLQERLRQLKSRTDRAVKQYDPCYEIRVENKHLYIFHDGRDFAERFHGKRLMKRSKNVGNCSQR